MILLCKSILRGDSSDQPCVLPRAKPPTVRASSGRSDATSLSPQSCEWSCLIVFVKKVHILCQYAPL